MTLQPINPVAFDFNDMLRTMARVASLPKVFPGYVAFQIKRALLHPELGVTKPEKDFPGADVGQVETIGDCRYAMTLAVHNGTRIRVTVEVEKVPT